MSKIQVIMEFTSNPTFPGNDLKSTKTNLVLLFQEIQSASNMKILDVMACKKRTKEHKDALITAYKQDIAIALELINSIKIKRIKKKK